MSVACLLRRASKVEMKQSARTVRLVGGCVCARRNNVTNEALYIYGVNETSEVFRGKGSGVE